ncbi:MmcQ/YjbR family DNA-binding protein [Sciscionella sediminilitoris]|uniref:MmcQ/YjbR family DNA-binding protein n=1 Tax=Sciscionella sediminilitoris TaxID=1445613 RepID=UPI00068BD150|nr:MmcQ/YjbR family DNA-binding protein [Sciscionella sp. SE31]
MGWGEKEREQAREKLLELAERLPGIEPAHSHGHTGFLVRGKRIAWFLVDHHGDGRLAFWVKAPIGEQEALVGTDPARYFVPAYLGPRGWVGVDLNAAVPDWDEIAGLLEQAWRMTATKAAIRAFDAGA